MSKVVLGPIESLLMAIMLQGQERRTYLYRMMSNIVGAPMDRAKFETAMASLVRYGYASESLKKGGTEGEWSDITARLSAAGRTRAEDG